MINARLIKPANIRLWSPTGKPSGNTAGKPVAARSFADSLRERRDLVTRHPGRNPDLSWSGLNPWLSAVGVMIHFFLCSISLIYTTADMLQVCDFFSRPMAVFSG